MKITTEHFNHMKQQIEAIKDRIPSIAEGIRKEGKYRDFDERLRWDVLYASGLTKWVCDNLYSYCNDDHIDTALTKIMRNIGKVN